MKFDPIRVFISSNQREFQDLRNELAGKIDKQSFHDQEIMKAITIEDEYGEVNKDKIADRLEKSSIYVGIFGRHESAWTFAEYRAARARDIPTLIYYYKKPMRRGRPKTQEKRGRPSEVMRFLQSEVKPCSTIYGYDKPYTSDVQLEEEILDHLAMQIAEMVAESARVRKAIHKASVLP